jgi:DNA polymerase III gamma/tau subunit
MIERRVRLHEKYRPHRIKDFIVQPKIKQTLLKFIERPYPTAFLFVGNPGVGKTSIAQAIADEIGAEFHHKASRQCNFASLTELCNYCDQYAPNWVDGLTGSGRQGGLFFVLIDEIDEIADTANVLFLSKLDSTQAPHKTVFAFTCNSTKRLTERFTSRCIQFEFSTYGLSKEIVAHLEKIWHAEGGTGEIPDFKRIVNDCRSNIRDCLIRLEGELLARG